MQATTQPKQWHFPSQCPTAWSFVNYPVLGNGICVRRQKNATPNLRIPLVLMGNLFSNFLSFVCFFDAVFKYVPGSIKVNQMMQRMSKARSYSSLARGMSWSCFRSRFHRWPGGSGLFRSYCIVTSLTSRDVVPVKSRRNFVEREIYARWQTNTFRLPSVLYMYWGFNPCVWVYLLAVWFLSCTQNLLGFSRCAEFHPCNLTSDISVQNFVDKAISPSNLRWLVPVSLFFDSFSFKRSMQKSKPKASQHFCRVGLYNFVISSYHGNGLFVPTF